MSVDNFEKLLLCPLCKKEIVDINLIMANERILIEVNCSQQEQKRLFSIDVFLEFLPHFPKRITESIGYCPLSHQRKKDVYCFECNEWLCADCFKEHQVNLSSHYLYDFGQVLICQVHQREFTLYCHKHSINVCPNCKDLHIKHKTIPLKSIDPEQIQQSIIEIDNIINLNNKLKDDFNHKSSNEEWQSKITTLWNHNNCLNQSIKHLYESLYQTTLVFKAHLNYNLMQITEKIQLKPHNDFIDFDIERYSNEEYTLIQNHFINNLAINIKPKASKYHILKNKAKKYECFNKFQNKKITQLIELQNGTIVELSHGIISILDPKNFEIIKSNNRLHFSAIMQLPDGNIALGNFKTITILNSKTLEIIKQYESEMLTRISCFLPLNDGTMILNNANNKSLQLWDMQDISFIKDLRKNYLSNCVIQLSNGTFAISSHNIITIWDKDFDICLNDLRGHTLEILCMIQLMNGFLVSGGADVTIRIWNEECVTILRGHESAICCVIQLIDGSIASAEGVKGVIRIWNEKTFHCIVALRGQNYLSHLIQLQDGTLVSNSQHFIKFWKI